MKASERAARDLHYLTSDCDLVDCRHLLELKNCAEIIDRQFERLVKACEAYYNKREQLDDTFELCEMADALREVKGQ